MLLLFIDRFFLIYTIMLFVRIVGSWLPEIQQYRFMQFIAFYTDPYLQIFRQLIPPLGMFDLSPIFAFIGLNVLEFATKKTVYIFLYS